MLVDKSRQHQPYEKYRAFLVVCLDIRKIAQRVGWLVAELPSLSVRQGWWTGVPNGARFSLKRGHKTLRIEKDVAGAAQVRHQPATIATLLVEVASHLEWRTDEGLNLDAVDYKIPTFATGTLDHHHNVEIAVRVAF